MYGNETIECQHDGTWTSSPQCLQRCDLPNVANSNLSALSSTSFSNSSMINITCVDNAKLHGNTTVTCNNGTWSDLPTCQTYKCYKPTLGPHDNIEDLAEYLINSTFNVTCDKGYDGDLTAYCRNNGTWFISGSCGVQACSAPLVIANSFDNYNLSKSYFWNDTFVYR